MIYYEEPDPNEVILTQGYLTMLLIWSGVGLAFGVLSILAAITFNKSDLIGGVYCVVEAVAAAVVIDDFGGNIIFRLLFAYPHIGLFLALKKGTISRETYEREKYLLLVL